MKSILLPTVAYAAALLAAIASKPQLAASTELDPSPTQLLERGSYLVNKVGLCIDCHSPRGPNGAFVEGQHLAGAPLGFDPKFPMPWAPVAPKLAGLPAGYDAASMTRFLVSGERPNGLPPALPPMPEYRFNQADAEAVTPYLLSLRPSQ